jgi:CRP/FNR family cyclic AMP-dependent transcriptional regulator
MTIRVKLAQTTNELDQLFRVRHRVFVEEDGYMPERPGRRIYDHFDAFPTTANVIAIADGRVVGGVRFTEPSPAGSPADGLFDFGPYLPPEPDRVVTGSMLVLDKQYRGQARLTFALNGMGLYWAVARGMTHVIAAANPDREASFLKVGYRAVVPQFFHADKGLYVVPIMLDLQELNDRFLTFVRHQGIQHFLSSFERQFHVAGETVIQKGNRGGEAFVIIDGKAGVRISEGGPVVEEMGESELFGEIALLSSRPRTASVIALTDLDLMVLERNAFREQLLRDPVAANNLLEMLANRFVSERERVSLTGSA